MALTPRQVALYVHQVTVWRSTETFAADAKPGALSWAIQVTGVPCYCNLGKSQQTPQGAMIMVESDNQFTWDEFAFEDTADVLIGDVLKMTTGPETGAFWTVRGNPTVKNLMANKLSILATRTPNPPNGVS